MGFYSSLPCLVTLALLLGLASTPLLRLADTPPTDVAARVSTIDGLRGLLALAVFFHHGAIFHQYAITGEWRLPPSRFYANLGPWGVGMFFMITGYLFWSQMLKARGRPDFLKLYVGRLFRIVPLYLVLALIVLVWAGFASHWRLNESPFVLFKEVGRLFAGGALNMPIEVNGHRGVLIKSAGMTWTLHYEWLFYASLIVTAFFARARLGGLLLPAAGLATAIGLILGGLDPFEAALVLLFSVGMIAAAVQKPLASALARVPQWALSAAALGAVALALTGFDEVYDIAPELLLGVGFLMIVSGTTLFGLLLTRPARRLGDISYGIYLLQGPVLALAFGIPALRAASIPSPAVHWSLVAAAAVALAVFATLTHVLVERPGIQAGRWASRRIGATLGGRPAPEPPVLIDRKEPQPQSP
ncbi:MAG TPA: acyltransferase [Roseiarcus sp.]|nr:acyltransferase [Roseiarcus sp.]